MVKGSSPNCGGIVDTWRPNDAFDGGLRAAPRGPLQHSVPYQEERHDGPAASHAARARLDNGQGPVIVLVRGPQVIGDTLVGYINGVYEEMPSAHLKQVLVEAPATTRTVLLVSAITVGLGGMIYALLGTSSGDKYVGSDYCEEHPEDPACAAL